MVVSVMEKARQRRGKGSCKQEREILILERWLGKASLKWEFWHQDVK